MTDTIGMRLRSNVEGGEQIPVKNNSSPLGENRLGVNVTGKAGGRNTLEALTLKASGKLDIRQPVRSILGSVNNDLIWQVKDRRP